MKVINPDNFEYYEYPLSKNKETKQEKLNRLLSEFELEDIENYLRVKKIQRLKGIVKSKGDR